MYEPSKPPILCDLLEDEPDMAEMVIGFVNGLSNRLDQMRQALDQEDLDRLATLAHQLKGAGGGFGYPVLTEKAAALEMTARAKRDRDLNGIITELAELIERVQAGAPKP